MAVTFYHSTTPEAATAILAGGFTDSTGTYLTGQPFTGVWLSDRPLDENEGAKGHAVLEVTFSLPRKTFDEYEWVNEWDGPSPEDDEALEAAADLAYREWLVPAELINTNATVRLLSETEARIDAVDVAGRESDRLALLMFGHAQDECSLNEGVQLSTYQAWAALKEVLLDEKDPIGNPLAMFWDEMEVNGTLTMAEQWLDSLMGELVKEGYNDDTGADELERRVDEFATDDHPFAKLTLERFSKRRLSGRWQSARE